LNRKISASVSAEVIFQTAIAVFSVAACISFVIATRQAIVLFDDPDPRQMPDPLWLLFLLIGLLYGIKAVVNLVKLTMQKKYIMVALVPLLGLGAIIPLSHLLAHLLVSLL